MKHTEEHSHQPQKHEDQLSVGKKKKRGVIGSNVGVSASGRKSM